jgi:hypothetical protein
VDPAVVDEEEGVVEDDGIAIDWEENIIWDHKIIGLVPLEGSVRTNNLGKRW